MSLDPSRVRGPRGRLPNDVRDSPVLLCSERGPSRASFAATEVKDLMLNLSFRTT